MTTTLNRTTDNSGRSIRLFTASELKRLDNTARNCGGGRLARR
jgi:hypothetical protein